MKKLAVAVSIAVMLSVVPPTTAADAAPVPSWYRARAACVDEGRALRSVGLTTVQVRQGEWIAWRETRCGADLVNERTDDHGHWQFNAPTWLRTLCKAGIACSRSALYRVSTGARAVAWVYKQYGWAPWCYNGDCPWKKSR